MAEAQYPEKFNSLAEYWKSDEAIEALDLERQFMAIDPDKPDDAFNEDDYQHTKRILWRAAPLAATSVAWLSAQSTDEKIRLRAASKVLDLVIEMEMAKDKLTDPLAEMFHEMQKLANDHLPDGPGSTFSE